jgi:hypothetical protein
VSAPAATRLGLAALVALGACRSEPARAPAPRPIASAGGASGSVLAGPGPGHEDPEAPVAPEPPQAPASEGAWVEAGSYRIRLDELRRCAGSTPVAPGPRGWVGALVEIGALTRDTFVSSRDLTIERGGVVVQAKYVDPPVMPGCLPMLPITQIRAGASARGFALFEVPASFREPGAVPVVLAYRPTRWGGARRTEIKLPDCFDACPHADERQPPPKHKAAGKRR